MPEASADSVPAPRAPAKWEDRLAVSAASAEEMLRVPATGPVLLCLWSPEPGADSVVRALQTLRRHRPDLRVWRAWKHDRSSEWESVGSITRARGWLERGGALVYVVDGSARAPFPAITSLHNDRVVPFLAVTLVTTTRREESRHRRKRSIESPTELLRVSSKVQPERCRPHPTPRHVRDLVRWHGHALRSRSQSARGPVEEEPIVAPTDPAAVRGERARLDETEVLLRHGTFTVAAARAEQIPAILREIGRLREETFRAVGEGTARCIDLDEYDQRYLHLFVWDEEQGRVAGAYRLGRTDELVGASGDARRLYTASLFDFSSGFFDKLGPALELGRSFVCTEYQKTRALLLLWKGIGQIVARERRFRTLFGPVSVSAEYTPFSRRLMAEVLQSDEHRHPLARLVRPRCPVERRSFLEGGLGDPRATLTDPAILSGVISSAENDRKGLPTLLNEYLRLGGRFLGFNVDQQFGGVMDGLVVVHLSETNPRLLEFYLGRDAARALLAGWSGAMRVP